MTEANEETQAVSLDPPVQVASEEEKSTKLTNDDAKKNEDMLDHSLVSSTDLQAEKKHVNTARIQEQTLDDTLPNAQLDDNRPLKGGMDTDSNTDNGTDNDTKKINSEQNEQIQLPEDSSKASLAEAQEQLQQQNETVEVQPGTENPSSGEENLLAANGEDPLENTQRQQQQQQQLNAMNTETPMQIETLKRQLEEALAKIQELQQGSDHDNNTSSHNNHNRSDNESMLAELQNNLQQQIMLKAEAENRARIAEKKLQEGDQANLALEELQQALQQQMSAKAEAENKARLALEQIETLQAGGSKELEQLRRDKEQAENTAQQALERVENLQAERDEHESQLEALQNQVIQAREETAAQRAETEKIREEREEQHRKEMSLTSRLNAAKMKEADKANLAEQFEGEIRQIEQDLHAAKKEIIELKAEKQQMELEMHQKLEVAKEKLAHAERSLAEEKRLNEERKRKMKAFVETKAEELRQANVDNDALQVELSQTNRSLLELNNRWTQLHAQYVQSQTRNRELQRDLNKIKKDSENLHKVGDTLEMKLSQSATETAEHKNKRLAAKHELMTVLRALEAERDKTTQLRDAIKFTFTPKALSQQQLLQETLEDFEAQLQKLSLRLGKPLPPPSMSDPSTSEMTDASEGSAGRRDDVDFSRLIEKLERETQAVSQCIMALTGNIERMHLVLDASGERSCVSVLAEILTTGTAASSPAAVEDPQSGENRSRLPGARHRYGTVPSAAMH